VASFIRNKVMVIANPASSNGRTRRRWAEIERHLREEGISYDYVFTGVSGDAIHLTRSALQKGYNDILAIGGDGTLNEVVNGFFDSQGKSINPEAALNIISLGTGSDFVRSLKLPRDISRGIKRIKHGKIHKFDLGKATFTCHSGHRVTRFFLNITGMGLDGETVSRVNRTSKAGGGFISFLWGVLCSLLLYQPKIMKVVVDGEEALHRCITILVVANGQYFGGGMKIAPDARLDDGYLEIITVDALHKWLLMVKLFKVYRGTHLADARVNYFRGKHIKVSCNKQVLLDMDGEQPGNTDIEIEVIPGALKVKV